MDTLLVNYLIITYFRHYDLELFNCSNFAK